VQEGGDLGETLEGGSDPPVPAFIKPRRGPDQAWAVRRQGYNEPAGTGPVRLRLSRTSKTRAELCRPSDKSYLALS
jgi:hypothetical protein